MSREIDRSKPLSDEDRRYLVNHGEDSLVALLDERFPEGVPEEPMTPDLDPGFTGDGTRATVVEGAPEGDAEDPGYEEWSAEDLRAEIDERNEGRTDKMSKGGGVAGMAARLREDDSRTSA